LTAHGQLRAYERGICRQEIFDALEGTHYVTPSRISGSPLKVMTGANGVRMVVDRAQRLVITVYRIPLVS
jgi:hypothetical protein